jgi:hypothetical protein
MQTMLNKGSRKNRTGQTAWTKRAHGYDGTGRLVKTTMKQWYDGDSEPAGDSLEHIYDKGRMLQNYDGSSAYGDQWRWAGSQNSHASPLHSPNADTASQTGYNLSNDKTPQRRSFLSPTTEGDQRNLYGQGKPQAKDSSGSGANWYVGVTSQPQTAQMGSIESRLFFEGTVTATDMDRATDTREKGRVGITGSAQAYAGSYGRVTSEAIGRDINPLGRGSGLLYLGGALFATNYYPRLPKSHTPIGNGNSANNSEQVSNPINGDCGGFCKQRLDYECRLRWLASIAGKDMSECDHGHITRDMNKSCPCCEKSCSPDEWKSNPEACECLKCECDNCGCDPCDQLPDYCCPDCGCCEYPSVYPAQQTGSDEDITKYTSSDKISDIGKYRVNIHRGAHSCIKNLIIDALTTACNQIRYSSVVIADPTGAGNHAVIHPCVALEHHRFLLRICEDPVALFENSTWHVFYSNSIYSLKKSGVVTIWRGGIGCSQNASGMEILTNLSFWSDVQNEGDPGLKQQLKEDRAAVMIHEMLHFCDCKYSSHKPSNYMECNADPSLMYMRSMNEGFADSCAKAIAGSWHHYHGYTWTPQTSCYNSSWCCVCAQCSN